MKSKPGTYILVLQASQTKVIQIGALGKIPIKPGYYLYVGSARGPGGVKARVKRHLSTDKKHHWHIDYLSDQASIIEVWYAYSTKNLEHTWAQTLSELPEAKRPIKRFGSSDCSCLTHLIYFPKQPSCVEFQHRIQTQNVIQAKSFAYSVFYPTNHIFD